MKTLDAIDRHLLALLLDNSRLSLAALARAVGLSRSAVQERLARLERSNVIEKYTVRLGSLGQSKIQAWLFLAHGDGFTCDDVMPALLAMPEILLGHSIAGEMDLMLFVELDSSAGLGKLRERILALKGVDDVTTISVLDVKLDRR